MWFKVVVGLFYLLMGALLALVIGPLPVLIACAILFLGAEVWGRVAKKAKG